MLLLYLLMLKQRKNKQMEKPQISSWLLNDHTDAHPVASIADVEVQGKTNKLKSLKLAAALTDVHHVPFSFSGSLVPTSFQVFPNYSRFPDSFLQTGQVSNLV